MSRDNAYIVDVLNAAQAIRRFLSGVSREQFLANEEKYEAVSRKFEIMGEAARHLSPTALKALSGVPWRNLVGMRNVLIHDYDDVDLDIIWSTAQEDLPRLIPTLETYLATLPLLPSSPGSSSKEQR